MNKFQKYFNKSIYLFSVLGFSFLGWSCRDKGVNPPDENKDSTILVYAVATNSLSSNLVSDKNEMVQAASEIDLNKNNILVFETKYDTQDRSKSKISLLKLVKNNEGFGWETVKDFSDGIDPLNPSRISEVINYVSDNLKATSNGLIFWSHSTGSQPYLYTRTSDESLSYSFGQDLNASTANVQINVDQLADAVPDNFFDFIWFDSCYMSNIETIYEFRNKCSTFVGYPTEVLEYGLPYNIVLPYMVGTNPDLIYAAELFYRYYENRIATIAVVDMNKIYDFSEECHNILKGNYNVSTYGFMKYTRYTTGPFYELGDYVKAVASEADLELSDSQWNNILDQFILYKAATASDFSYSPIYADRYSGISAHVYSFDNDDESERYYKSLDWYKDVVAL